METQRNSHHVFRIIETIGNANEETIRAYVQNQLKVMDLLEIASKQINLF